MDIIYVSGMAFLTTISRYVQYRSAKYLLNKERKTIYRALDRVLNKYNRAGYTISDLSADNEFEPILAHLENEDSLNVNLHIAAAQEHVPEAE